MFIFDLLKLLDKTYSEKAILYVVKIFQICAALAHWLSWNIHLTAVNSNKPLHSVVVLPAMAQSRCMWWLLLVLMHFVVGSSSLTGFEYCHCWEQSPWIYVQLHVCLLLSRSMLRLPASCSNVCDLHEWYVHSSHTTWTDSFKQFLLTGLVCFQFLNE